MSPNPDRPSGLRRAALALHSLGHADRDWLLDQLPLEARQSLEHLLGELRDLGFPPDADVIRVALRETSPEGAMGEAQARKLCRVLVEQQPAMQGLLLAALPESQRSEVLSHWPRDILARPGADASMRWTPALRDAVMRSWYDLAQSCEDRIA